MPTSYKLSELEINNNGSVLFTLVLLKSKLILEFVFGMVEFFLGGCFVVVLLSHTKYIYTYILVMTC